MGKKWSAWKKAAWSAAAKARWESTPPEVRQEWQRKGREAYLAKHPERNQPGTKTEPKVSSGGPLSVGEAPDGTRNQMAVPVELEPGRNGTEAGGRVRMGGASDDQAVQRKGLCAECAELEDGDE